MSMDWVRKHYRVPAMRGGRVIVDGRYNVIEEVLVTTHKRQFVHILREDQTNTICGAQPNYYGGMFPSGFAGPSLVEVTEDVAENMHHCKRCFPPDK